MTSRFSTQEPQTDRPSGIESSPQAINGKRSRYRLALLALLLVLLPVSWLAGSRVQHSLQVSNALDQGARLLEAGESREAEQAWLEAARLAPDNPNVYRALGALYRAQGRVPEERVAYNRLADLSPQEPHLLCTLAAEELRLSSQGMYEATARDAVRAAQLEPQCVRALTVAGEACIRKGDQKQAIAYLRRAVRLKPEDVPLTLHLINTMLQSNDAVGALEVARGLTRRYPGYAQGYALVAVAAGAFPRNSPEAQSAEGALLTALRLDPTNALAHFRLGQSYNIAGDGRRALPHLEAALLLHDDRSALLFQLSQAYAANGRPADAARALDDFHRISALENAISALEKQQSLDTANVNLDRRLAAARAALAREQRCYEARRAALLKRSLHSVSQPSGGNLT